jgi:hypothetical protein
MRRGMAVAACVLGLTGCGGEGELGRLAAGTEAIADDRRMPLVVLDGPDGRDVLAAVRVGARLRVVRDDGPTPDRAGGDRPVRVELLEGEHRGAQGRIPRDKLRPAE